MNTIDIVYQDPDLLIINKPSGLLSVPGRGPDKQDCAIKRVLVSHPNARVVHRLDMSTSGLLMFALNHSTQVAINQQFQQRDINKRYIAIVDGVVKKKQGEIKLPLSCDWPNRPKQMVDVENGKASYTEYHCLHSDAKEQQSRLLLIPHTGRSHQLRVHCLAMGHVILGDALYASGQALIKAERLCLHAQTLNFFHPSSGEELTIKSDCPF